MGGVCLLPNSERFCLSSLNRSLRRTRCCRTHRREKCTIEEERQPLRRVGMEEEEEEESSAPPWTFLTCFLEEEAACVERGEVHCPPRVKAERQENDLQ